MPSLLPSQPSSSSRSYAPLADELNPPFGSHSHSAARNGTIVYGQRASSLDEQPFRSESQETLSPRTTGWKGKSRVMPSSASDDHGDIGEIRRGVISPVASAKGKGKERAWDEEMGDEGQEGYASPNGSYPPVNEAEEAERRIQENLSKLAARDMARRRAAREARQTPPSPVSNGSTTTQSTSFMRRPFSMLSSITTSSANESKRASLMGMVGGMMGGGSASREPELPIASPTRTTFHNPYEPAPSIQANLANGLVEDKPGATPLSPIQTRSPFNDPQDSPGSHLNDFGARRNSSGSGSTASPPSLHSPIDGDSYTYGYVGSQWNGGGGAAGRVHGQQKTGGGDKWWHALCAWGSDLDGGHGSSEGDNQAGRTNPFE